MNVIKLDRSRDYGEIIGSTDGEKYSQDGNVYDTNGCIMVETRPEEIKPESKKLGRPRKEQ